MSHIDREVQRIELLLLTGRTERALEHLGRALASSDDPRLHRQQSAALLAAGDTDGAVDAAQRALEADPSAASHQTKGRALRAAGCDGEAAKSYRAAIGLRPDACELHIGLALSLVPPGGVHDPRAIDHAADALSAAHRLGPPSPSLHYAQALLHLARAELPEAATAAGEAIALDPSWAPAHVLAAHIRASQGMGRLASHHLAAAGRLDPGDRRPLDALRELAAREVVLTRDAERIVTSDRDLGR